MSKVTASTDIDKVSDDDVSRYTEMAVEDIVRVVNGNLDFATNFNCKLLSVTFSAANTQVSVAHGLGRVPTGYIVTSLSAPATVYNGDTAWNAQAIYLKASAPTTVGLMVY